MFIFVVLSALVSCALGAAIPDGLLPQLDGRIVGGVETSIQYVPYQVSVQKYGAHVCGGSIYSMTVIVTAAHCLQNIEAKFITVRAGSTYKSEGGTVVQAVSFKNNPNYNSLTMAYDVAVIRLSSSLTQGTTIQRIELASDTPANGLPAGVSGWGVVNFEGESYEKLRYTLVIIISREKCGTDYYYTTSQIKATMICAGALGRDACQGDSGGPLVVDDQLVGIVSWGKGCAADYYPGVYSNVAVLRQWIVANA